MANDCTNNGETTKNGFISPNNNFIVPEETNEIVTTSVDTPLTNGLSTSECAFPKIEVDDSSAPPVRDVEQSDLANSIMDVDQGDEPNNGPKYKCYICDKLFSRNSSLKCHIRLHLESPASILRKGSNNRLANESTTMEREDGAEAVDPLATASTVQPNEEGLYECHLCTRTFDRKKGLFRHIGYHNSAMESHMPQSRVDSLEDAGSDIELSLADESSMDQEDGGPQFECVRCGRRFKTHRAMKIHATQAHRDSRAVEDEPMEVDDDPSDNDPDEEEAEAEEEEEEEEEEQFQCDYCGRVFHSQRARSIHFVHAHKSGNNHKSSNEGSSTPKSNATATPSTPVATPTGHERELYFFVCAFCRREFKTCRLMNTHIANEHANHDSYMCVVCERRYDTIRAYNDHGRGICGKAQILNCMYVYACEECPKTFAHPKSMSRHMREHRTEQDQLPTQQAETSEQPEKRDGAAASVAAGAGTVTGGVGVKIESASVKCHFCTKCYPNMKALAGHMKVHNRANGENSGGSPTTPSNGSGPASSHHHNNHQQAHHAGEDDVRLYPCPYCDRTFTSNVGYAGHMKVHKDRSSVTGTPAPPPATVAAAAEEDEPAAVEGEKIFVCRICNKKFTSGVQLGGHMRHHTAATKAASNIGSGSGVSAAVAADAYEALHLDTDTVDLVEAASQHEDDQYICDTCDKTFVCKEELSEHVQYHVSDGTIGSPFGKMARDGSLLCEYCERPFNGVKSLKTHMYRYHRSVMMHTAKVEDKVYKCDCCNLKFSYLSELKKHTSGECFAPRKRPFVPDDTLRCEFCDQTFLLRCHLQKHMKSRCNAAVDLRNEPEAELTEPETMNGEVGGGGGGGGGEFGDILASKRVRKSTLVSSLYEYEPIGGARRPSQKSSSSAAATATGAAANPRPADLGVEYKPFECGYCEKCFDQQEELIMHVRGHVESCELDDDDFNEYVNLHAEEHFVIESEYGGDEHFIFERYATNEGYQCSECDETYRDKLQMIIHMSFHVSSKLTGGGDSKPPRLVIRADSTLLAPYKCKFCDERFVNKTFRNRHLCKCHRDDIMQCASCDKLFLHREKLKQHVKLHALDTKYRCEYCRRGFTSKWFMKRHTKLHCAKRTAQEAAAAAAAAAAAESGETLVDGGYHCKSEKIETEQADSEIIVDHFVKEEMPATNEVVVHMQMQSV